MIKKISIAIYGILGFIFFIGGIIGFFKPDIHVSPDIASVDESYIKFVTDIKHLTLEMSAGLISMGILFLWSARNTDKTEALNKLFIIYTGLFGVIHWMEYFQGNRDLISPLINSLPIALILSIIILRKR